MFIERLMNKEYQLTKTNMEDEIAVIKNTISYFTKWISEREEMAKKEKLIAVDSARYYIAQITYENVLTFVRGFIHPVKNTYLLYIQIKVVLKGSFHA